MPAWNGGPCPGCAEEVPPRVLRCPSCRTLLDPDLSAHEIPAPEFTPLAEVDGPTIVRPKAERTRCPAAARNCESPRNTSACRSPARSAASR